MTDFSHFVRAGWRICRIDSGKSPTYPKWNTKPLDEEAARDIAGAGLLHALSGTCALDLDNLNLAQRWLADRGVDLQALLEADDRVQISSGRPNRAKLLYKLSKPMLTFKPEHSGLELRSATAKGTSVQDVLPGTVHPDTGLPYVWEYGLLGDWADLPPVPATLLSLWRELAERVSVPPAEGVTTRAKEELAILHHILKGQDPNGSYDDWLRVGMALHHDARGGREGFDLWNEWSKASPKYPGWQKLWEKYQTFTYEGKSVVTIGSLLKDKETSAPEEFDVVDPTEAEAAAQDDEDVERESNKSKRERSIQYLVDRLIWVKNSEHYFDSTEHRLIGSNDAIQHEFTCHMDKMGKVRLDPVKLLKETNKKRIVSALGFHPGEGVVFKWQGKEFANTYRNEAPAPIEPTRDELEKIEWMFARLEDDQFATWLKQFYAHIVQRPAVKIVSAPLLWSNTTGNGKNTLMKDIPELLVGAIYSKEVSAASLETTFTDYLQQAWHIHLAEFRAVSKNDRDMIKNKLKPWITDPMVNVIPKGKPEYTMPNHFFVTASSNYEDASALDNDDRRWAVHEFPASKMTQDEKKWLFEGFLRTDRAAAVLRHYFLNVDLTGFDAKADAPLTRSRTEMVANSQPNEVVGLMDMIERHEGIFAKDAAYVHEIMESIERTQWGKWLNTVKLGRLLSRHPFNCKSRQVGSARKGRFYAVSVRNHARFERMSSPELMAYIEGDNIVDTKDDPLLD